MIEKLGKYNIIGELGQGAMGTVYKGEDPLIGRVVAIKTISRSALAGQNAEEAAARFKQEAQAAGRLSHPNIVVVYDYGEEDDVAFIAMAFIEGRELKSYFDKNELFSLDDIVSIMDQLLDALHVAHASKIVHRDIKPSNIMVNENGRIMITDFGIARLESSDLTQVGATMGTPNYMAPEQCMGQRIDGRADIFSAAVILYQLLTGEKPFAGPNITSIMHKILKVDPVPPSDLNVQIPKALDAVVAKGVAKRPEDRYATAHEFREAIRNAVAGKPTGIAIDSAVVEDETIMVAPAAPVGGDETIIVAAGNAAGESQDDATIMAAPQVEAEPEMESRGSGPASRTVAVPPLVPSAGSGKKIAIFGGIGAVVVLAGGIFLFTGDKANTTAEKGHPSVVQVTPSVQPTPQPPPVTLSAAGVYVDTNPPKARVLIDGVPAAGLTPLSLDVTAGHHEIVVAKQGYYDVPVDMEVGGGDMIPLTLKLHRKQH
jgi:serine/threonine-protein kinase